VTPKQNATKMAHRIVCRVWVVINVSEQVSRCFHFLTALACSYQINAGLAQALKVKLK
jgi:hypothetical protein